jgi:hypothetical protein
MICLGMMETPWRILDLDDPDLVAREEWLDLEGELSCCNCDPKT